MKVQIVNYVHPDNGISLQLMPETELEIALLKSFWTHGTLGTGHPCSAPGGTGYYITAFKRDVKNLLEEKP